MRKSGKQVEITVPYNGKIADINESDTSDHTLDLETALSETREIVEISVGVNRISGTGDLNVYPNEETLSSILHRNANCRGMYVTLAAGMNRLKYAQSVANDDFDLRCFGYRVKQ